MKGIFVSGSAKIGEDCVIFQQVTIGSNTLIDSAGFGAPLIGDRCYIGAGAKVIGRVRVGDDVRVGANAVVSRDVPSNSVVVAGDHIVLSRDQIDNRFYSFHGSWMYFSKGCWIPVEDPSVLSRLRAHS
jgi:serine O-acetyltransferase